MGLGQQFAQHRFSVGISRANGMRSLDQPTEKSPAPNQGQLSPMAAPARGEESPRLAEGNVFREVCSLWLTAEGLDVQLLTQKYKSPVARACC